MIDTLYALLGRRHCPWCVDRPPTWWDRLMRFDQLLRTAERPLHERLAMRWSDVSTDYLPAWKLGQRWHWARHVTE